MFTYRVLKMEGDSEAILLMNAECILQVIIVLELCNVIRRFGSAI